ncbi:MAG: HD domain-containing protein [Crocosphaera sp.]|nr:HD domain-containing protein [Crocosphaera sp.]
MTATRQTGKTDNNANPEPSNDPNAFFEIVNPNNNDKEFSKSLGQIKNFLFPQERYLQQDTNELFKEWSWEPDPKERVKNIEKKLDSLVKKITEDEPVPFLSNFHQLFLKRQWKIPYVSPQLSWKDLVRLEPDDSMSNSDKYNYSKFYGDYRHFINVVAALARLIMYFQKEENITELGKKMSDESDQVETLNTPNHQMDAADYKKELINILKYEEGDSLRTFQLILAGFYHDIGKTVQNARHAMEGRIILESRTTDAGSRLRQILAQRDPSKWNFDRDDFLFISNLVLYHDQYGTLSTGEDSYLQLVDVIDCLHRYSIKKSPKPEERLEWSRRCLFDLWLLNVADIMVSTPPKSVSNDCKGGQKENYKYSDQPQWNEQKEADRLIEEFLDSKDHGSLLIHDLEISLELLEKYCSQRHSDDLSDLRTAAHQISLKHSIERLRRLMVATLHNPLTKCQTQQENEENKEKIKRIKAIAQQIFKLSEENWDSAIVRAIDATVSREEFSQRFSWLKKSDYALGFFEKIAQFALDKVQENDAPGWTYKDKDQENKGNQSDDKDKNESKDQENKGNQLDENYKNEINAQYFADNYVAVVIEILGYLLFRESSLDKPRNVEFKDATDRLTDDKLEQILNFEGLSRNRQSIELILQTIYVY